MKKSEMNGHGNAHGSKLARLLAAAEADVAVLRRAIVLLNGADAMRAAASSSRASVLADALDLDAKRRAKTGKTLGRPRKAAATATHSDKSQKEKDAIRRRSARILQRFADAHGAVAVADLKLSAPAARGIGALVRRGYLKKSGDGYVRTEKTFEP